MAAASILDFEFRKMLIISSRLKQFSPNLNCIYLVPTIIDQLGQIWNFSKIQDGGGRHLSISENVSNFRKDEAILIKF